MSDKETQVLCRIEGRVQQVGYRAWTQTSATRLGVRGWVRNEDDGSVSACFAGPAQSVQALIEACRQGPPGAAVTAVNEQPAGLVDTGVDTGVDPGVDAGPNTGADTGDGFNVRY